MLASEARATCISEIDTHLQLTVAVMFCGLNDGTCVQGPSAKSVDFSVRLSWSSFAMSFFDATTVSLQYNDLEKEATYAAHVVFNSNNEPLSSERSSADDGRTTRARSNQNLMRLVADNMTVWRAFSCCLSSCHVDN
eukprot:COSAG02_NODE_102_length_36716_cov_233.851025_2_plen_137_part_00